MKLYIFVILYFICTYYTTNARIVIEEQGILPEAPTEFLEMHPQIEVQSGTASEITDRDQNTLYFKISFVGRNKKIAYDYFIKRLKILVQKLAYNLLIPSIDILIQSPIQVSFLNKKRMWQFSRNFGLRVNKNDQEKILKLATALKLTPLKHKPVFQDQRLKQQIMDLFNSVKLQLQSLILNKYDRQVIINGLKNFHVISSSPCPISYQFQTNFQLDDIISNKSQYKIKNMACNGSLLSKNFKIRAKFSVGLKNSTNDKMEIQKLRDQQVEESEDETQ